MLLTNIQVSKLCKAFTNNSSTNIKLWKTRLPLMKNVLKALAKSVLIPLDLTAALAIDAALYNKMFGPDTRLSDLASRMTTLIISNEEMNDIMKIVKSPEESGLLIKVLAKPFKVK